MSAASAKRPHDQFRDYIDLLTTDGPLAVLDQSLAPRPPDFLFEFADKAGFGRSARILDAGCADGGLTVKLAERFGCDVDGVDYDETLLAAARARARAANVEGRVHFSQASFERLLYKDGEFDAIWCRQVVYHVHNLPAALAEGHRVTLPGARLVIQTCVETESMDPRDAERIYGELTLVGRNVREPELLAMLDAAGWDVRERLLVGSETKEYREESEGQVSRALMRLARLLRRWDDFTTEFGEDVCLRARAVYEWTVYQMLGKISVGFYLAEHRLRSTVGAPSPRGCATDALSAFPEPVDPLGRPGGRRLGGVRIDPCCQGTDCWGRIDQVRRHRVA